MKALIQRVMKVSGLRASAPPASGDHYTWVERHIICVSKMFCFQMGAIYSKFSLITGLMGAI